MYLGYSHDRKELGFTGIKDVHSAKQISDLKNFIKRTTGILVVYIVKKGKELFFIIFSKEVLVALLILGKSISTNVDPNVDLPSPEVYQYWSSEFNNLKFKESLKSFKPPSTILDSILKLKGGSNDDWNEKELEDRIDGTFNKQETTINFGDRESGNIVAFEKNPLYEIYHFLNPYQFPPESFESFLETGNIGLSPAERQSRIDEIQKVQAKTLREQKNEISLFSNTPNDARISNRQLAEAKMLKKKLETDYNYKLTEKEERLLKRSINEIN